MVAGVVYVAFNANRGLPLQSTYTVTVDVPGANKLAATNDVRIAGIRVGQVADVTPVVSGHGSAPIARIKLALKTSVAHLPTDTQVKVRPASILGTTFIELAPGRSSRTVRDGGSLPLRQAKSTVDLTDLLDIFDQATASATQTALTSLGQGVSGRGTAINQTLRATSRLLPPFTETMRTLARPETQLGNSVQAYDTFVRALSPSSERLARLFDGGSRTFGSLVPERRALGAAIDAAGPAERTTTASLVRLQPSLDRLADLAGDLRAPVRSLRAALWAGSAAVNAGVAPLTALPPLARNLGGTLTSLGKLSRDPNTSGSLRKLRDMTKEGLVTLETLVPAQVQCNVISLFAQSFGTAYGSVGFKEGPPMAFIGEKHLGAIGESLQNAVPSSGLAVNVDPNENYDECESGNEPYPYGSLPVFNGPGKPLLGNPPGLQSNTTLDTYPPPGVHDLARRAGVLPELPPGETIP